MKKPSAITAIAALAIATTALAQRAVPTGPRRPTPVVAEPAVAWTAITNSIVSKDHQPFVTNGVAQRLGYSYFLPGATPLVDRDAILEMTREANPRDLALVSNRLADVELQILSVSNAIDRVCGKLLKMSREEIEEFDNELMKGGTLFGRLILGITYTNKLAANGYSISHDGSIDETWESGKGKKLAVILTHNKISYKGRILKFSDDGRLVFAGSTENDEDWIDAEKQVEGQRQDFIKHLSELLDKNGMTLDECETYLQVPKIIEALESLIGIRQRLLDELSSDGEGESRRREYGVERLRQASDRAAAKREHDMNYQLLLEGKKPVSEIHLTPEEERELESRGLLPPPDAGKTMPAVVESSNPSASDKTNVTSIAEIAPSTIETKESSSTTNSIAHISEPPIVCGIKMGEPLKSRFFPKPASHNYAICQDGEIKEYTCYCEDKVLSIDTIEVIGESFSKHDRTSVSSHSVFSIRLFSKSSFEATELESDFLSKHQMQLSEEISKILAGKYGEPTTMHTAPELRFGSLSGERVWYFEKDGLYVTLKAKYFSSKQTEKQKTDCLRTYNVETTIEYIHLPSLESAIEEGRQYLAKPQNVSDEEAKKAAEML